MALVACRCIDVTEVINRAVQYLLLKSSAVEVYGVLRPDWWRASEVVIGSNCSYEIIYLIVYDELWHSTSHTYHTVSI